MNNFEVLSIGTSRLVSSIADCFKKTSVSIENLHFADTETFLKISNDTLKILKNKNIFLIYQFSFQKKLINDQLLSLMFLINILKKLGNKRIVAFLPYLPYVRSNKSDYGNFIGNIDIVCKFLKLSGIEKIISCDLHSPEIKDLVDLQIDEIELVDFWSNYLKKNFISQEQNICFVAPDKGAIEKNRKASANLGVDFAFIEKVRVKADSPMALDLHGDVKNKTVIILDDIIDTAKTAVSACDLILKNGAKKVIGCFSHSILSHDAIERIEKSKFEKVFVSNTILFNSKFLSSKFSVVNIGDFICQKISTLKI